eukprot:TRINITY_DN3194_c0_g1_i1.p4 TRINITY_DN3194_c0_g1~~TRINITY_DN3194_c0_g1_i1.p4  ORF type:complete len:101 (+),score=5.62 TRINITY_DN3194_c0_g1_i1:251-553(+)
MSLYFELSVCDAFCNFCGAKVEFIVIFILSLISRAGFSLRKNFWMRVPSIVLQSYAKTLEVECDIILIERNMITLWNRLRTELKRPQKRRRKCRITISIN